MWKKFSLRYSDGISFGYLEGFYLGSSWNFTWVFGRFFTRFLQRKVNLVLGSNFTWYWKGFFLKEISSIGFSLGLRILTRVLKKIFYSSLWKDFYLASTDGFLIGFSDSLGSLKGFFVGFAEGILTQDFRWNTTPLVLSKESLSRVYGIIFTRVLRRIFTRVLGRTFTWVSVTALGCLGKTQCSAINCVGTLIQCALVHFFVTLDLVIRILPLGRPGEHTILSYSTVHAVWFDWYRLVFVTPDWFLRRQNIVTLGHPESSQCSAIECICS